MLPESDPASFLLTHFDRLAEAPGGIAKIRSLVLQFAVLGKAVEPTAEDTPIDRRILASKKVPTNQAEGRTGGDLGPVTFEEMPYHLPPRWSWGRMFQLCEDGASIVYGILQPGPNIRPHGVPYVRPSEIENGGIVLRDIRHTTKEIADKYERAAISTGDVLLTIVGTIGATAVVPPELDGGNITQSSCRLRPDQRLVDSEFLLLALRSPCLRFQFDRFKLGTAVPRLNIAHVRALAVPLPPLAEQRRIVAKVEELMGLCDALEAAQQERETVRTRLRTSALHQFASPDSDSKSAAFVLENLPQLIVVPEDLTPFRDAVSRLSFSGQISDSKSQAAFTTGKTVGDFVTLQNGYAFKSEWFIRGGIRLVRNTNVGHGQLDWSDSASISLAQAKEFERFALCEGDIVLSLDRPLISTGLKAAVVRRVDLPSLLLQRVGRAVIQVERLSPEYFFKWLHSPLFKEAINPGRSNGVPHISSREVEAVAFNLPPLAEQRRIVAKVDELMAVLAALEATLTTARTTAENLLAATLARLHAA